MLLLSSISSIEQKNLEVVFSLAHIFQAALPPRCWAFCCLTQFGWHDGFFPLLQSTLTMKRVNCVPCNFKYQKWSMEVTYAKKCVLERHSFGSTVSPIRPGNVASISYCFPCHSMRSSLQRSVHTLDILHEASLSKWFVTWIIYIPNGIKLKFMVPQ